MLKITAYLSLILTSTFFFLNPIKASAQTVITGSIQTAVTNNAVSSMDIATLYWIYYGKPLPVTASVKPTMRISTPTVVFHQTPTATSTPKVTTHNQVTSAPSRTPTAIPTPTKTQPQPVQTTSVQDYIMKGINDYRTSQGKAPVKTDSYTCNFASVRAGEIVTTFTHDGFTNRVNNHTLPYPSYHEVTENIAETSDYQQVVPMWIASAGHAENMRADTAYVCVEQSGNYYAYEGWRP